MTGCFDIIKKGDTFINGGLLLKRCYEVEEVLFCWQGYTFVSTTCGNFFAIENK